MVFREDVIEGSAVAALIVAGLVIPFLLVTDPEAYRKGTDWFAGLSVAFVLMSPLWSSMCSDYWQVALLFFLGVGLGVLAVFRFSAREAR